MQKALLLLVVVAFIPRTAAAQGEPVGPEFRINTYTTGDQGNSSVASDASGNFVVVWTSEDGSSNGVFGQRYAGTGAPLGPEFRVNTYTTDNQFRPAVASDSSGDFVVVWNSPQDGSSLGIFGQRYSRSGAPLGTEFRVNTYTTGPQGSYYARRPLAVASDSSGNFVVVWQSGQYQDPSSIEVFGQRFDSSGAPLGPEFHVNTYTYGGQSRPAVASDSSGTFVVVWESLQDVPNPSLGIFGQRYAGTGEPLGPEFRVNTYEPQNSESAVASDSSGHFVVVWQTAKQDGSDKGVFGRICCSSTGTTREFRVNTYTTDDQFFPAVASDASGNFVVVWESRQDGSVSGVFGQRFASTGAPLGPEFRVNTYTTGGQDLPAVASDSTGNFVVVWHSIGNDQDGSGSGVFGQRYNPIVPPSSDALGGLRRSSSP